MTPKKYYISLICIILLVLFSCTAKTVFSQTCSACPGDTCEIICGQTLSDRSPTNREYFRFNLDTSRSVTITLTPSSLALYDLIVKWDGSCPSTSNYDCYPGKPTGQPQTCTYTNLPAGTYYIMVDNVIFGAYSLSLSCSGVTTTSTIGTTTTSTTLTTTTLASTSTSTTSLTTSTSTTSLTTSTSTTSLTTSTSTTSTSASTSTSTTSTSTTSPTSTVPLISLQCQNTSIYVRQSSNCTVSGCQIGHWLITNFENRPLERDLLINIPPNSVYFGPTNETGKILTEVVCQTPYTMASHITDVVKGPNLICPKTCYVGESCECEVVECRNGVYLMDNIDGEPLEGDMIKDITSTSFSYEFTSSDDGAIRVRMFCYEPYETKQQAIINVTSQVVTTTVPGDFQISEMLCSDTDCTMNIRRNTRSDMVKIFIRLIKEPEGIVYYSGKFDAMPSSVGLKTTSLRMVKTCTNGVQLKMLALAYPYPDLNDRLIRIKEDAFIC